MDRSGRVLIVGAGIGGLACAVELARRGIPCTVLEKAPRIGGKMREVLVGGRPIDGGPTVLTMRSVFDEIFDAAGESLDKHLTLDRAEILARHAWTDGSTLDLFSDIDRSADAIGAFAGPKEARGYRRFCEYARDIHEAVRQPFLLSERPGLTSVVKAVGTIGLGGLRRMDGYRTMWTALSDFFEDPRLVQLFGRYATYSGSSPFLAPATLNVIAHVEREGVWLVRGGMYRLAEALLKVAEKKGALVRTSAVVQEILTDRGRATGVRLASGEVLSGRAVVLNADAAALSAGLFGASVKRAESGPSDRSLSAMTWAMTGETSGFSLIRHNVFFSSDYEREFADLLEGRGVPVEPTVYVCAQDRDDSGLAFDKAESGDGDRDKNTASASPRKDRPKTIERLFCLINARADGDRRVFSKAEIERCETAMKGSLTKRGLTVTEAGPAVITTPADFERMFPATGGALYGAASHGALSPFSRPSSRCRIPGLYLCGGSAHPGAGVPMVAQSGRLAAQAITGDLASTSRSLLAATLGGMWTR